MIALSPKTSFVCFLLIFTNLFICCPAQNTSVSIGYSIETSLFSPSKTMELGKVSHSFHLTADKTFYSDRPCVWGFHSGIVLRSMSKHADFVDPLPNEPHSIDTKVIGLHIPLLASLQYHNAAKTKMSVLFGMEIGTYLRCSKFEDYGEGPQAMDFPWRTTNLDAIPVSIVLAHSLRWFFNQTYGLCIEPYISYTPISGFYELNNSIRAGLKAGLSFQ